MDEREDYCCAVVADCDCPRCRAANNQPSKYDELRTDLAAMTEARNELLRDIQQNLLPDLKRLKQAEARLTALLEDRTKLAEQVYEAIDAWYKSDRVLSREAFVADRLIAYLKPLG